MIIRFAFLSAALLWVSPARASLVWDQSPQNGNGVEITHLRVADDFVLSSPADLTSISFWYFAQFQTDLSSVAWAIYDDAGGALGSVEQTGAIAPSTSDQAGVFFATFAIPSLSLGAGTYWLELHSGTSLIDDNGGLDIDWANANDNATKHALLSNVPDLPATPELLSGFQQQAFQISSDNVPEPSPAPLVFASLLGLIVVGRSAGEIYRKRAFGRLPGLFVRPGGHTQVWRPAPLRSDRQRRML